MSKYVPTVLEGWGGLTLGKFGKKLRGVFVAVVLTGAVAACSLVFESDVESAVAASRACDAAGVALGSATDLHAAGRMGLTRTLRVDKLVVDVAAVCEAEDPPADPAVAIVLVESAVLNLAFGSAEAAEQERVSADTVRIIAGLAGRAYVFWQTYQASRTVVTPEAAAALWDGSAARFQTARLAWDAEVGIAVDVPPA